MKKKVYCKPELIAMEIQAIPFLANSGGTNMPPANGIPRLYAPDGRSDESEDYDQIEDMDYIELEFT